MPTLVCLSDTHGFHRRIAVPHGDILIHAGDITLEGDRETVADFDDWLASLPHRHKIVICGNHDFCFEAPPELSRSLIRNAIYLQDEAVEVEGLKFYGTPWQPYFGGWAFNLRRGHELAAKWSLIPADTDVLTVHGPPAGILDRTKRGENVGCEDLLKRIREVKPRLVIFGHIHEAQGREERDGTVFVNASVALGNPARTIVL